MNRRIWTRGRRKWQIVEVVRGGGAGYTVREIGDRVGLKPSRYLRELVAELVAQGLLAYWEYELPSGLPMRVYMDAELLDTGGWDGAPKSALNE